ncbi:MAG: efflux RND transporter periplasmic adaptor subunit [Selenomonadaceae bacterium]|nr:efflux RND transporter periplasmic adaptor subunit [Selenomonadaceae bacterium]
MKKFLILMAAIIFLTGCGKEQAVELPTEKISAADVTLTLTRDGKISLSRELMIYSNVSGEIVEKFFKDGDEVKEGQKLFKVGSAERESELLQAKRELSEAMTSLPKELAQKNSVGELQNKISELQARVKILEDESEAGMVFAPITGRLDAENLRLGETVTANETVLAKIGKANPAVVRFEVSAAEKNFLAASNPKVMLKFKDGSTYARPGKIIFSSDTTAEVTFDNPDESLPLGEEVQLELENVKIPNALLVPENAIQQRDGENFVNVVDENKKVVPKKISLGGKVGNQFVVSEGLQAGDTVQLGVRS